MIIPTITLHQWWASLVEIGAKPYETRDRPAPKRLIDKRVAIHAALRKPRWDDVDDETRHAIRRALDKADYAFEPPLGVVLCTAIMRASVPAESVPEDPFGDYSPGRWAWPLEDVRPVTPYVRARGYQLIGWAWDTAA